MLDIGKYRQITAEECWEEYGWGSEARPGSTVYCHWTEDGELILCDLLREEYNVDGMQVFGCEIYDNDFMFMIGQWFDVSCEDAIRGAAVDSVVAGVMREECCREDAANVTARLAYVRLFGECPIFEMDVEEYDKLLSMSKEQVKSHIKWADCEWEEF